MERTTLEAYRHALYECFGRGRDALFDVCDALATGSGAPSFVEVSQAPSFRRRWPSLYAAVRHGQIDPGALRTLFVPSAPRPATEGRLALTGDTSPIPRPYAQTVPERTRVHGPAAGRVLPPRTAPVQPGWAYSTLGVVPDPPSSWTHLRDNRRLASDQTATQLGAQHLAEVVPLLAARPVCLADGADGTAAWVQATAPVPCDQLVRAAATRVLYSPAPPPTGRRGRPALDGPRFQGSDPATQGAPDGTWTGADAPGQAVGLRWWSGWPLKAARAVPITVVCLTRARAAGTKRDPRDTWFWGLGGRPLPPPAELARLYPRRFRIEHGYRFDKQDLLWAAPRLRTPAQMDHWTQVVRAVHHELGLARGLGPGPALARGRCHPPLDPPPGPPRRATAFAPPRPPRRAAPPTRKSARPAPRGGRGARSTPSCHPQGRLPPSQTAPDRLTPLLAPCVRLLPAPLTGRALARPVCR